MIEFVKTFIWVVAAVGLFLIQKWLSSRKVVWLGSIMPVLTIISGGTLIWYMKWEISVRTVLPFVLLFVLFTITWLSERATLKKSRSKESCKQKSIAEIKKSRKNCATEKGHDKTSWRKSFASRDKASI